MNPDNANFENTYVDPRGRTSQGEYIFALVPILVVLAMYFFLLHSRNAQWCMLVMLAPATVLHARRLRDMGVNAWAVMAPFGVIVATLITRMLSAGSQAAAIATWAAVAVSVALVLWCAVGKSHGQAVGAAAA